jgi:hypothetical protein
LHGLALPLHEADYEERPANDDEQHETDDELAIVQNKFISGFGAGLCHVL